MTINSDLTPIATMIKESIAKAREGNAVQNQRNRDFLNDFYHGRQGKDEYLKNYGFDDIQIPLMFVNLTKKIINKISLIYKWAPDRHISKDGKKDKDNKYQEWLVEYPEFNIEMKRAERLKNLFHNILFRPMVFNNKWNFWIETEWIPHFADGDPLKPIAYSIPLKRDITKTTKDKVEEKQIWMFWSDEKYYWHDEDGKIEFDPNYPDGKNPFGTIPFIEMRKESAIDEYWAEGVMDLAKANQAINVILNDLNYTIHFQAFNQLYGRGIDQEKADLIKTGAHKVIGLSEPESDLSLLNYSPQITQAKDAIKSQIEIIANSYNVNIKWSLEGSAPSGFSLLVQNIDLLEAREDDVNYAQMHEKWIYEIIQIQDKYFNLGGKLPALDKKNNLIIDFQEINFPVNQKEELSRWDWKIKNNANTIIDFIQSDQGLSQKEAEVRYNENKILNSKLSLGQQKFREELNNQGVVVESETDITESE